MIAQVVYLLCAVTAGACAGLLFRAFRRSRVALLLWAGICFVGLCLNNAILFVDRVVYPDADLWMIRTIPALIGVVGLLWGLVWESS